MIHGDYYARIVEKSWRGNWKVRKNIYSYYTYNILLCKEKKVAVGALVRMFMDIEEDFAGTSNGTVTINWSIDRVSP
jgi:hypothetical protein